MYVIQVKFPEGADWVSWWNASEIYKAGDTVKFSNISLYKYTVFCKQGTGYTYEYIIYVYIYMIICNITL